MSTHAALATRLRVLSRHIDAAALQCLPLDAKTASRIADQAESLIALADLVAQQRRLDPLPRAQARVLTFVRRFILEHTHAPTRQEIATALGFKSANGAHEHLKRLAARGVLTLIEGAARGIRLNKRGVVAANTTITRGSP